MMRTCLILLLLASAAHAATAPLNFFTGAEGADVCVATPFAEGETLSYRMAHEHRTLAAGTARVGAEGVARLPVALPEMKAGVALPMDLTLSRRDGTQAETRKAWVFSKALIVNPARKIHLIDTDGKTAEMLEALPVAFESVRGAETITALTNALIIVGGGWNDSVIWRAVLEAAERGADVLLLAPAEESVITLPHVLHNFNMACAHDILRDPRAPYELAMPIGGLRLTVHDGGVALRMDDHAPAQAAQWKYGGGGRVRVCGLPLIPVWEKTPAARWLLAEMITTGEKP